MSELKVLNLEKSFGVKELFKNVSFSIQKGERVALIGRNGKGKTTLFNCLIGKEEIDKGEIIFDNLEVGYLEQEHKLNMQKTIGQIFEDAFQDIIALGKQKALIEQKIAKLSVTTNKVQENILKQYAQITEAFEQKGGYAYQHRIKKVAFGLGFTEDDLLLPIETLSGGQKTRVKLVKALIKAPDILLLDEPTNHLDIAMTTFLEEYLLDYKGSVLFISHDRYFINRVASKILELANHTIKTYQGNYTHFAKVKKAQIEAQERAYDKQQTYIQKTEEYIQKYKAGIKAKQARGRQSQLNRLQKINPPEKDKKLADLDLNIDAPLPQKVLELSDITLTYQEKRIFQNLSLILLKGEKMALIGKNGAGKTSLLKLIIGTTKAQKGTIKIGKNVQIAYFSQEHENLNPNHSVLEEIQEEFYLTEQEARNKLATFLFQGDAVFTLIKDLSGGEKARLALLKIMLQEKNLLLLDEPTNHLDIEAKEVIEKALKKFQGSIILVSHDRWFLNEITNITLALENGKLQRYDGNYSYYEAKKDQQTKLLVTKTKSEKINKAVTKLHLATPKSKPNNEKPPTKRIVANKDKLQAEIAKKEAQILMAEIELKAITNKMNDYKLQLDPIKSKEIADTYAKKEAEIKAYYTKWEELLQNLES